MHSSTSQKNSPITFEVEEELLSKLKRFKQKTNAHSLSETIRHALRTFKFEKFRNIVAVNKQISIRLPKELKDQLTRFSTEKKVSIGELLRVAIQNLCLQSPNNQTKKAMIMATTTPKRTAARKPAVRKPATKKVAVKKATATKTAAKKPAAKKAVAKKPAVKKVAKKATTAKKKTTVKKAAVKKTVARKPAVKKTVAKKTTAKKK